MIWQSDGKFTFTEIYDMPVYLRHFYARLLVEKIKKNSPGYTPNVKVSSDSKPKRKAV